MNIPEARLSNEEILKAADPLCALPGSIKWGRQIAEAQLAKAAPIIEAQARKEERERIVILLKEAALISCAEEDAELTVRLSRMTWQSLKGEQP